METAVPLLYPDIEKMAAQAPVTIAFPDDGASKRFSQTVTPIVGSTVRELIICAKIRKADGGRIVKVRDGDPSGSHVVIIDDLVMTGGTMIECANVSHVSLVLLLRLNRFLDLSFPKNVRSSPVRNRCLAQSFRHSTVKASIKSSRHKHEHPPAGSRADRESNPVRSDCKKAFNP